MKIRWTGHSVRLRISPTDLAAIARGDIVNESLCLPPGAQSKTGWRATILPADVTGFAFADGEVRIALSEANRAELAKPDREGIYFQVAGESEFRYFIEKDFPCVHPRPAEVLEPETETFEPPPGFEARKINSG